MALIDLLDISKHYEAQKILEEVNFHINKGDRTVIVGKNGSGKSTLMKIVNGSLEHDEGERIAKQTLQVKMLPQNPRFEPMTIVRDAIEAQLVELKEAKLRYDAISLRLADEFDNGKLLDEHSTLSGYLDHHNAWNLDDKIERVMREFQLKEFENRAVELLSGGEQRRVALAGLLLQKPDILLLDEPTNHLDVYMVEFLEELLLKEKFTLLFISHDRYFIDRVATNTIEIEDGSIREFKGGYNNYLNQKSTILEAMHKQHNNLLRLLKRENEWFARGVRARLKRNEGRKDRLMQLRNNAKKNPTAIRKMKLELQREQKHFNRDKSINRQKMLFELENINLSLGSRKLIKNFSTRVLQKDTIAIVGPNGSGKSTLLGVLLGRIKASSGKFKHGEFKIGYFDQQREMLNDDKNLIETFCPNGGDRVEVQDSNMHVYGYLKNFLFPKEFLNKKIGTLSGGEKNRVALALLFTKKVDCLILDEPTNDLDIPTINILEERLQSFSGSTILVSHDRYFVDKIADKLFVFKGNGEIEESYQNYTQYLEIERELRTLSTIQDEIEKPKNERARSQKREKLSYKEIKTLEELPAQIESMEAKIDEINGCLASVDCYQKIGLVELASELKDLQSKYEEASEQYLQLEEKREEIES